MRAVRRWCLLHAPPARVVDQGPIVRSPRQRLVVIGNGMAGMRTVEELIRLAPGLYDITVFGAEPHPNYNRILLSPVLTGEQAFDDIILNDEAWYAAHGIRLYLNRKVVSIHRGKRVVIADDGTEAHYDRLLLATGSRPYVLPVPGNTLGGVVTFRDAEDVQCMIRASATQRRAVVIGGGLLGLEAANGLANRGMSVTVVHVGKGLLDRQLDTRAAALLQSSLRARGLRFLMQRQTAALIDDGAGQVRAVRMTDGEEVPADLVVMAVGIRPNTELAEQVGLFVDRGIVVSDTLQTYDPRIYAVGECVNHRGIAYGLVAPLFEQARVAANHLARHGIGRYQSSVTGTRLKVTGIELFSAGDFMGASDCECITLNDSVAGIYKKLVIRDDCLVGACLYGDAADGAWYEALIRTRASIAAIRDQLMFGPPEQIDDTTPGAAGSGTGAARDNTNDSDVAAATIASLASRHAARTMARMDQT